MILHKPWLVLLLALPLAGSAQKEPEISIAFTNQHTAYPFSSFSKLFSGPLHPGAELGYRFNWRTGKRHDWFQSIHAGYFYHRFLQHGVPVYTQVGYRYKFNRQWRLSGAAGAGYLHAVPATAVLKLEPDGTYTNAKGLGRGQVLLHLAFGAQYRFKSSSRSTSVFADYRQQIQTPFVKSYVPLLPYNSIAVGASLGLTKNKRP